VSTIIHYFSGTGNSLCIAEKLKERLPEAELVPLAGALKEKQFVVEADHAGFVFPCHGTTIPIPVKLFLQNIILPPSCYVFAIVTRAGSVFSGFDLVNKLLAKTNNRLNSGFIIDMGFNDPKLKAFSVPDQDELDRLEGNAFRKLELVNTIVSTRQDYSEVDLTGVTFTKYHFFNRLLERLIPFMTHCISPKVKKYFYADANCIGCGICEKVCLSEKITMKAGRPFWKKTVTCYLCLN
jgi:ferredoxin